MKKFFKKHKVISITKANLQREFPHISSNSIDTEILKLEDEGVISVERKNGHPNSYEYHKRGDRDYVLKIRISETREKLHHQVHEILHSERKKNFIRWMVNQIDKEKLQYEIDYTHQIIDVPVIKR